MSREEATAEEMYRIVLERFGDRLDPHRRREVRQAVEAIAADLEALRAVPLDNADGPLTAIPWPEVTP